MLLAPTFSYGQDTLSVTEDERNFCLSVVKSVIEHNCEEYFESIADSFVLFQGVRDTLLLKSLQKKLLMGGCGISVRNDSLDYQYYLDNFFIEFYDVNEIAEKIWRGSENEENNLSTLKYYEIKEGDIYFMGAYHKTRNRLDFIVDDAFKFVFRKIDGEYKVLVITP